MDAQEGDSSSDARFVGDRAGSSPTRKDAGAPCDEDGLAAEGRRRMHYVASLMPVMTGLGGRLAVERPLAGLRVAFCSHLEPKTAHAATVIRDAGAAVVVCGANPMSTCDDVVAALRGEPGIRVLARHGATPDESRASMLAAVEWGPDLVADDGGELIALWNEALKRAPRPVRGACEQTTTGVVRVRALAEEGLGDDGVGGGGLAMPVVAVNECRSKHLFDNRYGTGESVWTAVAATTNATLRGSTAVVVGYGRCGRGIAAQARGMGARVIVTEIDPVKALEAHLEGFTVMPLAEAAARADFVVTATGVAGVFGAEAVDTIADGAFLCNAGHADGEIDADALARRSAGPPARVADNVDRYTLPATGGRPARRVSLVAGGSIVNLAAGKGHAAEIIDTTFALQVTALVHLASHRLAPTLQGLPGALDDEVAALALAAKAVRIDPPPHAAASATN